MTTPAAALTASAGRGTADRALVMNPSGQSGGPSNPGFRFRIRGSVWARSASSAAACTSPAFCALSVPHPVAPPFLPPPPRVLPPPPMLQLCGSACRPSSRCVPLLVLLPLLRDVFTIHTCLAAFVAWLRMHKMAVGPWLCEILLMTLFS